MENPVRDGDDATTRAGHGVRARPWSRGVEVAVWLVACSANAIGNTFVVLMDARRYGQTLAAWQPVTWEWSSALMVLALLPLVLWACDRWPIHVDNWRRRVPAYAAASLLWSAVHVLGMVGIRKAVYATAGDHYDFGDWPHEFLYEYLKDVRTFALIVTLAHGARWLMRRVQGEARLLDAPDEGPPVEPVERPERFLVRKLGREFLVAANDIEWLQASANYVNLRVRGHDYPLRSTIAGIEPRLDPSRFARIHRSYIVNLDQVVSIEPLDTGDARVHLKDGGVLPCSRRQREALRDRIGAAATTA